MNENITKQQLWEKISKENANLLFNLRERWQDEKEYENIDDYLEVIKKSTPQATKIYKRPFGVDCKCKDGIVNISVKVKGNYLTLVGKDK